MAIGRTKVAIVGCGSVGSTLGYYLVSNQSCNELVMIDRTPEKAWAQAKDLEHSLGDSNGKIHVYNGTYEDCRDADVAVLCVAAPYREGMTRLDMYQDACRIMDVLVPEIMKSGFQGIFIVITNPVDLMTQYVWELSGLPSEQVIGTGTALDSSRLRMYLAELMDVDPRSVNAFCMGEHGDSQMIPWSQVTVGGKSFAHILADNPGRLRNVHTDKILEHISKVAYDIVRYKGATYFGIASTAGQMIRSILFDENKVLPVSCLLQGEYETDGIYAGVPAVLCSRGIKEKVTYHLTEEELRQLKASFAVIRGYLNPGIQQE